MNNDEMIEAIQREAEKMQQPLLARIDKLEAGVKSMTEDIWALNVMSGILQRMVPIGMAEKLADELDAELRMLPSHQVDALPSQDIRLLQQTLAKVSEPYKA